MLTAAHLLTRRRLIGCMYYYQSHNCHFHATPKITRRSHISSSAKYCFNAGSWIFILVHVVTDFLQSRQYPRCITVYWVVIFAFFQFICSCKLCLIFTRHWQHKGSVSTTLLSLSYSNSLLIPADYWQRFELSKQKQNMLPNPLNALQKYVNHELHH